MSEMTWKDIEELAAKLALLGGEAREAFRESVIHDLAEHGYSRQRAEQVLDETEARFRKKGE